MITQSLFFITEVIIEILLVFLFLSALGSRGRTYGYDLIMYLRSNGGNKNDDVAQCGCREIEVNDFEWGATM